jgi:hypothetical protein
MHILCMHVSCFVSAQQIHLPFFTAQLGNMYFTCNQSRNHAARTHTCARAHKGNHSNTHIHMHRQYVVCLNPLLCRRYCISTMMNQRGRFPERYIHTYIHTYIHMYVYIYKHTHTHIDTYILTYIFAYIYIHTHTYVCNVYPCVCMYVCMYVCAYIHKGYDMGTCYVFIYT